MGIFTILPGHLQEVDIIIAGGGTAGCVVASRVADADADLSILVIEGGPNNRNVPTVAHPVLWAANCLAGSTTVSHHKSGKEEQIADRESIVFVGNSLGGGSSVNAMMYARAQKCDFDSWATAGWTADDLLPYLKKLETYHGPGKEEHHGNCGPIQVSGGPFRSLDAESNFISAMKEIGYPEAEDLQDLESLGTSRACKYISTQGQRQGTAHTYLHPKLEDSRHPNLHVLVESQVMRVIFDGDNRASGVEFRPNPATQTDLTNMVGTTTVKAKKLIVLSCGTLGTPPILERSGVGDPKVLKQARILEVAKLPGVGNGYQDHNVCLYPYSSNLPPDATTDAIYSGRADIPSLLANNDKILGWNGVDASAKIRPTSSDVNALGPDFRAAWDRDFKDKPSKPLGAMVLVTGLLGDRTGIPAGQYFSIGAYTTYPYSRGHIHITGPDMDDPRDFKTGFLTDEHGLDLKKQLWLYKVQREAASRMAIYRGAVPHRHPVFPSGSKASDVFQLGTVPKVNIDYSQEDEAVIEDWIRHNVVTAWHGVGTCKMAPQERLGVVDGNLGVYGVRGLKIADLSIVPENVCANTMNTALVIGEKAADIFIQELGLGH
ncbi:alcohol oxidase-like protein [Xylaria cf. heliscus]|nr:alcohol oxidase-like protein [Xylaria cf. heliscus]